MCLRPSCITSVALFWKAFILLILTGLSSIMMPFWSRSSIFSVSVLSSTARYSFSTLYRGCVRRFASSPSFVKISSPSVFLSSRPTGYTRSFVLTMSMTVFMPCSSLTVVTTPRGLLRAR